MSDEIERLKNGHIVNVPQTVSVCPECGAGLLAQCFETVEESGNPTVGGLILDCWADDRSGHRWFNSDWVPVMKKVEKWCGAEKI